MGNPEKNSKKSGGLLLITVLITAALIAWVISLGRKAEDTVSVVMWATNIYKNETITEGKIVEYKMLRAEFEKYSIKMENGTQKRRIILWEERDRIINTFAAYPLQGNTVAMISDVIRSRTDNSDTVLYSFPGKNIVALVLGEQDLQTFKTFLEPGDRVNIIAIYQEEERIDNLSGSNDRVTTLRQETVFKDILIADLLNSDGESVLDLYAQYNQLPVYKQAQLDSDEEWLARIKPSTLLVALTPEEEIIYYNYLAKTSVKFYMSLPQRGDSK